MNPYDDNAYAHVCECSEMQLEIRSLRQRLDAERTLTQKFQAEAAALRIARDAMQAGLHATRKGSQPAAETLTVENQQALLDEERAEKPVSDVVPIMLETVIQRRIEELVAMADNQQREVAMKFLHRARAMLDSGTDDRGRALSRTVKEQKAWDLIKGACNVLDGGEADVA